MIQTKRFAHQREKHSWPNRHSNCATCAPWSRCVTARSLVRAAQLLNLTQSALSHQIKLLEDHYGSPLFERKSVPPQFSAAGQRLLALADAALPQVEEAERDIARLAAGGVGQLRIAVECHTCFDWLMPAMDAFRARWPEIELDIVSGFHPDVRWHWCCRTAPRWPSCPSGDTSEPVDHHALFRFDIVALMANEHALTGKSHLTARAFRGPDADHLPGARRHAGPGAQGARARRRGAGAAHHRVDDRHAAAGGQRARRGGAAAVGGCRGYLDRGYVSARPIGRAGLKGELHMACLPALSAQRWLQDFVTVTRQSCFTSLPGIELL